MSALVLVIVAIIKYSAGDLVDTMAVFLYTRKHFQIVHIYNGGGLHPCVTGQSIPLSKQIPRGIGWTRIYSVLLHRNPPQWVHLLQHVALSNELLHSL